MEWKVSSNRFWLVTRTRNRSGPGAVARAMTDFVKAAACWGVHIFDCLFICCLPRHFAGQHGFRSQLDTARQVTREKEDAFGLGRQVTNHKRRFLDENMMTWTSLSFAIPLAQGTIEHLNQDLGCVCRPSHQVSIFTLHSHQYQKVPVQPCWRLPNIS